MPHFATCSLPSPWLPWIFAAKTTASGLIALLVAFTFNLDQPQWALLTVYIVAQPQSGLVLAKSFYRIVGTLVGAAMALGFVAFFAQERVLFLGALGLWIGICTFGSSYFRNFAAYAFVLSGYTVAIVGIPGALDPGNAFYIATARVTEISLGIIVTATISHIILPSSLGTTVWQAIAGAREALAEYAVTLLDGGDTAPLRAKLLGQANAIENLRASAIFEDRELRDRSDALRRFDAQLIDALGAGRLLRVALAASGVPSATGEAEIADAMAAARSAIRSWRSWGTDAAALTRGLIRARARLPISERLAEDFWLCGADVIRQTTVVARLREFFTALTNFAGACDDIAAARRQGPTRRTKFARGNDAALALWTGVRAALAVILVSGFWILADWPHGSTAAVLSGVATARLATLGPAVPIAFAGTLIFSLATIPAFIIIEIVLPLAEGFGMFSLAVAPMLFFCAFMMAYKKTYLIGFLSALLFASAGLFQNEMLYDPVGLINTSIAAVVAAGAAMVLWAVVAPPTADAARRHFVRVTRAAFARIGAPHLSTGLVAFETTMIEALDQLQAHLQPDRPEDMAAFEGCVALVGAGRELIRLRLASSPSAAGDRARDIAQLLAVASPQTVDRAWRKVENAVEECLRAVRNRSVGTSQPRTALHDLVAFAAVGDELRRGSALLTEASQEGGERDAA